MSNSVSKMKISEVREMSSDQLRDLLSNFREKLAKLIVVGYNKENEQMQPKEMRKCIARILTILNERGEKGNA